jgi:hypothetical protein
MEEGHSNFERLHDTHLYDADDRKQARKEVRQLKNLLNKFEVAQ